MNLADMLCYADIEQLSRIASHYECECSTNSKNEMIQSILATVTRRDVFDRLMEELSLEDLRFISGLLYDRRNSFSLEELTARVRQTRFDANAGGRTDQADWNPRQTIIRFKQRGWLFNGHSQQTKTLFQIPQDIRRRFSDSLSKYLQRTLVYADAPEAYREEHQLMGTDVYRFLKYVHHHEVALTNDGTMYKRTLQHILDSLEVREDVPKGGWRFGYGRKFKEYPNRFSFLYDYCYFHQYIEERERELRLTNLGLERVEGQDRESPADLYRFWIRLYKGPVLQLGALAGWIDALCARWVTVESLKRTLSPFVKPFYYDTPESILEQRILQMMLHLGLVRVGRDDQGQVLVQMTALGRSVVAGTYVEEQDKVELPDKPELPEMSIDMLNRR